MARRRMIDPNFWQSEDVSKLTIRQRLLLIGIFSNADDEGRLRGTPAYVRSAVFPYEDFTLKEIENDLNSIESIGSIRQYLVDASKYIQLVNWFKFQRVDKPQKSVIPKPILEEENHSKNESKNDSVLKEVKGKEVNINKEKVSEEETQATVTTIYNAYRLYESEKFGFISTTIGDKIGHMIDDYTELWVCKAMEEAIYYGKRYLPYVKTVLEQWTIKNHPEPWLLERDTIAQKNNVRHFNRGGMSGKQHIPIITDSPKSSPMSPERKAVAMLKAKLLDGDINQEEYEIQIAQIDSKGVNHDNAG
jgi:DnaD/phage-associated family protein